MRIIDHGVWVKYKPEQPPKDAPPNAMYMRRESDGVDWYDYVRPNFYLMEKRKPEPTFLSDGRKVERDIGEPNFKPGSLICNVYHHKHFGAYIVGTATHDPTAVVPVNQRVIEIVGYEGDDPHAEFGGKVYDLKHQTFSKLVLPEPKAAPLDQRILDRLDAITARIEKLERKTNG